MPYPLFIASKSRPRSVMKFGTSGILNRYGLPHYIVVPKDQVEMYEKDKWPLATILPCLDSELEEQSLIDHNLRWDLNRGTGAPPQRNSCKRYAKEMGADAFWNYDDNVTGWAYWMTQKELEHYNCFDMLSAPDPEKADEDGDAGWKKNLKNYHIAKMYMNGSKEYKDEEKAKALFKKVFFDDLEPNLWKVDNVDVLGMNTVDGGPGTIIVHQLRQLGWKVYSCYLMKTDSPFEWWGQSQEDVMMSTELPLMNHNTLCFWQYCFMKPMTQSIKGGYTDEHYGGKKTNVGHDNEIWRNSEEYIYSTEWKSRFTMEFMPQFFEYMVWKKRIHHHFLYDKFPWPQVKCEGPAKHPTETSRDHLNHYIHEEWQKGLVYYRKHLREAGKADEEEEDPDFSFGV